jgi:MerR family transcriptional regulator, light-induced transcriptional regulator
MSVSIHQGASLDCESTAARPIDVPVGDTPVQRVSLLVQTIERDIIPRLMLVHRDTAAAMPAEGFIPGPDDVELLVGYLLKGDAVGSAAFVRRLRERGATPEALLLALLAPSARRLGQLWEQDRCDFTVVTLGLWRLQRALHELSAAFQLNAEPPVDGRRILLTAVPGEQHTFGLSMVAEFFRRAGWEVTDARFESLDELLHATASQWFAVVGLSIACERWVPQLTSAVEGLRERSRNTEVGVIVGGPLFLTAPQLRDRIGADAVATDAQRAVELAQELIGLRRLAS